jgi:hypothetical protein
MLAGHPALYCGPEPYLLLFESMAEFMQKPSQLGYPWMALGLRQTIGALYGLTREQAVSRVQRLEKDDVSTQVVYRMLQERIGRRLFVDKTPTYVMRQAVLSRAEDLFEGAKYLYMARHPCAAIESFVRMRFDKLLGNHFGIWDANPWLFAEKWWAVSNRNAIEFLRGVEPQRQHWVLYEDLVTDPNAVMREICGFLSIPWDDAVLNPYERMDESFELGDPNLRNHARIDPALATAWRSKRPPQQLSEFTRGVAAELGYDLE